MGSKIHNRNYGEVSIDSRNRMNVFKADEDDVAINTTYWRAKNPKIRKAKPEELILKNRFDFGKDAPIRYRNFAWLKKSTRKDYFGIKGKEYQK